MEGTSEPDYILAKWLSGKLTAAEQRAFEKTEDFDLYKRIVEETDIIKLPKSDLSEKFEQQLAYNKRLEAAKVSRKVITFRPWLYGSAATFLLLLGLSLFWNTATVVTTGFAENRTIVLPDSSTVIINADTRLTYDEDTFIKDKKIKLSGEAYFKVQKGGRFKVTTENGSIQVLGTEFNVYSREALLKVFCDEGKVAVMVNSDSLVLTKGLGAFSNKNSGLQFTLDEDKSPQWRAGKSLFIKAPLSQVLAELKRQFNITLKSNDIDISRAYSGYFQYRDLKNALDGICQPMNITYTIKGDKVELRNK